MATFFTADTHFGHESLITHSFRKFGSVEEMDDTLVGNWNAVVARGDAVWHLGDFTLKNAEAAASYARRLNGNIHLVWGNHDRNSVRSLPCWASSQYAAEIRFDGRKLTLCHYGMRVWNGSHHGSLMLFGHSHGSLSGNSQSLDVGVDAWGFRPVSLAQIMERMTGLEPYVAVDHHIGDSA